MITQFVLTIQGDPLHRLYADSAYRLYAYLLEQLPVDEATWLHEIGSSAVNQFLQFHKETGNYIWTVNVLSHEAASVLRPVLATIQTIQIESQLFAVLSHSDTTVTLAQLLEKGRTATGNRSKISFITPTSFKQNGRYTIFPQERLILQSLIMRWNEVFPNCILDDEDAFHALLSGIHIVDYRLKSTRFLLKGIRIPGFTGECGIEAKLALPLLELWNTLLVFGNYAGVGMKTGLGMGGVQIR